MKHRYQVLFIFLLWIPIFFIPPAHSQEVDYSGYLKETVESNESFWVRVHAAEALVENNFPVDVEKVFPEGLKSQGPERIGALRVLSKLRAKDTLVYDSLGSEILRVFTETEDQRTKLIALETLGKLGLYYPNDEEIRQIAETGQGGIRTMAQWVLANSGEKNEISKLTEYLFSSDSTQLRYAGYALRFLEDIPSSSFNKLKEKYQNLDEDHPFRVYLVSALWLHAPPGEDSTFLSELLGYQNGEDYERFEVFQALSVKGNEDLLSDIRGAFSDFNTDVKVSIAQAYLANEHYLQSRVGWLDWLILGAYGVLLLSIGWIYSFFQKSKEDYFLGGRNVNPIVSGISMYVSFFSAITYLAIAGEVIKNGPLMALVTMVAGPIIFILGSYFLIPFFMNLKMISAYEILEKPLGIKVRKIASVIFLLTRIVWMALLIFLASKAMVVMMGWGSQAIVLISVILGIITIIYTTMGGLKAVLITDVIQFVILLLGAILTIGMVALQFDGVGDLIPDTWSGNWKKVEVFNFNPYVRLTVFFAFINVVTWWICTTGSDQMAIQRFLSTENLKSARKSFAVTQVGMMFMTLVLMFVGFSVMKFYNAKPNLLPDGTDVLVDADFLFPHFIANQFPMGMSGLVIAALFSASMSSLSSGINSTSSVLTMDLLPTFTAGKNRKNELTGIRINSSVIGIVVILISLLIPLVPGNIIEVTSKTNGLFIAPLFNLFFMALFTKSPKPFGVVMGSIYGFLAAFTIAFWDVLTGNPPLSFLWILISSLLVSVFSSLIFNLIFPKANNQRMLFWGVLLILPWIIFFIVI